MTTGATKKSYASLDSVPNPHLHCCLYLSRDPRLTKARLLVAIENDIQGTDQDTAQQVQQNGELAEAATSYAAPTSAVFLGLDFGR